VMIDRGAQVLKIVPGGRLRLTAVGAGAAELPVDFAEVLCPEERGEPLHPVEGLMRMGVARHNVFEIEIENVSNRDFVSGARLLGDRLGVPLVDVID
jgi:hypothetical protein